MQNLLSYFVHYVIVSEYLLYIMTAVVDFAIDTRIRESSV
jgi:hypothetical protein